MVRVKSYVRADIVVSDVAKHIKPVEIETKNFLNIFNRVFLQALSIKILLFKRDGLRSLFKYFTSFLKLNC